MRSSATVFTASWVSAADVVATSTSTLPSTTSGGAVGSGGPPCADAAVTGVADCTPGTDSAAATTAPSSASGATTVAGCTLPASKWRASTFSPATESTFVRNTSDSLVPCAWKVGTKADATSRNAAVASQTRRGWRPISPATRPHTPVRASRWSSSSLPSAPRSASTSATWGIRGQKIQRARRPPSMSSAGSSVIVATNADAIPIAATGPSDRLEARSDSSRHSRPAITVPALAAIGSIAARIARFIARCGSAIQRSSSRYRATSSNE